MSTTQYGSVLGVARDIMREERKRDEDVGIAIITGTIIGISRYTPIITLYNRIPQTDLNAQNAMPSLC